MTRPTLVYVGHSYHRKTGSTVFLIKLLETRFRVVTVLDESWMPGNPPLTADEINVHQPEAVVFFQLVPSRRELRRLTCRNLTWVPMHDGVHYRSSRYRRYAGSAMKSLHFSAVTEAFYARLGYETSRVQYFPPPTAAPRVASAGGPTLLFWVRRKQPSWPALKALLGDFRPARIVLRSAPDPGYEPPDMPSATEVAEYRIELRDQWMDPAEYAQLMQSCDLFMAPRATEGIGIANLEAMAHGLCVIAPDAPTMNEYLRHCDTGYLYDLQRPAPLDFGRWREIGLNAHRSVVEGHRRWRESEASLLDFVQRAPLSGESQLWQLARACGL